MMPSVNVPQDAPSIPCTFVMLHVIGMTNIWKPYLGSIIFRHTTSLCRIQLAFKHPHVFNSGVVCAEENHGVFQRLLFDSVNSISQFSVIQRLRLFTRATNYNGIYSIAFSIKKGLPNYKLDALVKT
jgi:hypothetical protein